MMRSDAVRRRCLVVASALLACAVFALGLVVREARPAGSDQVTITMLDARTDAAGLSRF